MCHKKILLQVRARSKSSGQPLFLSIKFNFVVCALMLDKNHKKLCLKLSSLLRSAAGKIHCGRARLSCHDLPEVVRLINNHRLLDRFPAVSGRCTVFYSCARGWHGAENTPTAEPVTAKVPLSRACDSFTFARAELQLAGSASCLTTRHAVC